MRYKILLINNIGIIDITNRVETSFELSYSLTEKGSGSFSINCEGGAVIPTAGNIIEVYENESIIFYGMIKKVIAPKFVKDGWVYKITTTDPKGMLENRIPFVNYGAGSFSQAMNTIINYYLDDEGLSYNFLQRGDFDNFTTERIVSISDTAYKLFNNLCERAGAYWYVEPSSQRGDNQVWVIGKEGNTDTFQLDIDENEKITEVKIDKLFDTYTNISLKADFIRLNRTEHYYYTEPIERYYDFFPPEQISERNRDFVEIELEYGIDDFISLSMQIKRYGSSVETYEVSASDPGYKPIRRTNDDTEVTPYDLFFYRRKVAKIKLNPAFNGKIRRVPGGLVNRTYDGLIFGTDSNPVESINFTIVYSAGSSYYREVEIKNSIAKITGGKYSGKIDQPVEVLQDVEFNSIGDADGYLDSKRKYYLADNKKLTIVSNGKLLPDSYEITAPLRLQFIVNSEYYGIHNKPYILDKFKIKPIMINDECDYVEYTYFLINKDIEKPVKQLNKFDAYADEQMQYRMAESRFKESSDILSVSDKYKVYVPEVYVCDESLEIGEELEIKEDKVFKIYPTNGARNTFNNYQFVTPLDRPL